jgi:hypothetical protein
MVVDVGGALNMRPRFYVPIDNGSRRHFDRTGIDGSGGDFAEHNAIVSGHASADRVFNVLLIEVGTSYK